MKKSTYIPMALALGGAGVLLIHFSRKRKGRQSPYPALPPYTQNRVKVGDYARLPTSSPLLVNVPTTGSVQQRLHRLAAVRLLALSKAAAGAGFPNVTVASGWRPHRWKSFEHYKEQMIARYGDFATGRRWVAYNSPHETGLAIDFGSHGLAPRSATNERQKQTRFFKWLVANAHRFGLTPYKNEAWHWEAKIPREAWVSGREFTEDYGVYV